MTYDFPIFYTAGKNSDKNKQTIRQIGVIGDCSIMTYDPRKKTFPKLGDIKIDYKDNYRTCRNGGSVFFGPVHLSEAQAEILPKIAKLSGDVTKIEESDLEYLRDNKDNFGLTNVRYDKEHGVATVLWDNEMLRIDFVTESEKATTATATASNDNKKNVSKTYKPQTNATLDEMYQTFYDLIPEEYNQKIKEVAINTGVSENSIRNFILTEGKQGTREAWLTPHNCAGGQATIGFGHTNLCRGTEEFEVTKDTVISLDQAFQLLEDDIKYIKKFVIKKVGGKDAYNALPQSIQEACIDYAFHTGPNNRLNSANFKANVEGGYYGAIAGGSLLNINDLRRTAYRFMFAIEDLDAQGKKNALESFKNKGYYDKVVRHLGSKTAEGLMFIDFCNAIERE